MPAGRVLQARGSLADAAAEFRTAVEEIERVAPPLTLEERRAAFLADKWDVYASSRSWSTRGGAGAAFAASERMRARQMLDLLARDAWRPPRAGSALVEREQDLRRRIAELTQRLEVEERTGRLDGTRPRRRSGDGAGHSREALARAQEQYAQLLRRCVGKHPPTAAIVRGDISSWREVAKRLAKDE